MAENEILHEIFRIVSRFTPLHFMFYRVKSVTFGTVYEHIINIKVELGASASLTAFTPQGV